ncbi:MAG TPA: F0F1 ATP synthase subunit delta [Burkholderiales bacterium]|nr:F0F1 ATP synthase subunit delta [Burkholderiales bacterium]
MAETITIARPYAEAAFGYADSGGALAKWAQALDAMAHLAAHPEMHAAIGNPRLTDEQLYGLFASLCGDELTAEMQNFVRVLIENGRLALAPEIRDIFLELKNEREGVVDALVESAFPLNAAQTAALVTDLERRFKRKVKPQVRVDKELIGGVRVQVGDEVIDSSVRGQLATLASALRN